MDSFVFRFLDTLWEALTGVFRRKKAERPPKKKKKK